MVELGKLLIGIGVLLVVIGVGLVFGGGFGVLGRLPGDIHLERGNWSVYFPLGTSIVLSIALSLLFMLFSRR
jgi:hypothetical protein